MKDLTIGKNYGEIYGYRAKDGNKIIYHGGISFQVISKSREIDKVLESQDTYDKIHEYINRTSISMGSPA
jgi:hypothetical protein